MHRRSHLRIVVNNNSIRDTDRAAGGRDLGGQVRNQLARWWACAVYAWGVLVLPFRAIVAVWRFSVGLGLAIVDGAIRFFLAMLGVGVLVLMGYMVHQFIARS